MKKYFIIIGSLVLVLLTIVVSFNFINKKTKKENCSNNIELNEIYLSINSSIGSTFDVVNKNDIGFYLSMDFSDISDYLLASRVGADDEFYIIIRNLTQNQIDVLKNIVDVKKNINKEKFKSVEVETYNNITYVTFCPEYKSAIDGIIRNYIYCE